MDSLQKEVPQAEGEQLLEPKGPKRPISVSAPSCCPQTWALLLKSGDERLNIRGDHCRRDIATAPIYWGASNWGKREGRGHGASTLISRAGTQQLELLLPCSPTGEAAAAARGPISPSEGTNYYPKAMISEHREQLQDCLQQQRCWRGHQYESDALGTFLDHIPFVGFWHLTDRGETWLPALPYGSVSISFSWASFTTSVEERQGGCQTF